MSEAIETIAQEQAADGEFDELSEIMGSLGERAEDLFWWEKEDGTLLVSTDRRNPSTIAQIRLEEGELTATELDPTNITLRGHTLISSPSSGIQEAQFD